MAIVTFLPRFSGWELCSADSAEARALAYKSLRAKAKAVLDKTNNRGRVIQFYFLPLHGGTYMAGWCTGHVPEQARIFATEFL
jgi:hypothetical protein